MNPSTLTLASGTKYKAIIWLKNSTTADYAEIATIDGFLKFVNAISHINIHSIWVEGGTDHRIRVDGPLTTLYNSTYGTSGALPGTWHYGGANYFYAKWRRPNPIVLNNIYKLVNKGNKYKEIRGITL